MPCTRNAFRLIALSLFAVPALAAPETSTPERDGMLVSTSWLAEHLEDPDLVLLHVGDEAGYASAHLPGARHIALDDISTSSMEEGGLHLQMPAPEELRQRLASFGISDGSRIVVYWGKDWISPTTRVLFTLDYAGLGKNASLLDGGQPLWVKEGRRVTAELPPTAKPGTLAPLRLQPLVTDAAFVRAHLAAPGFAIVDARNPDFYSGARAGGMPEKPHKSGHIAGARSIPFDSILDEDGRLRTVKDLAERFAKAGIRPGDTVVTYCHIGQQATATLFAARALGHPVLLYDGSFEEWSRLPDAPVDGPPPAKPVPEPAP